MCLRHHLITINHPFLGAQNVASGPGVSSGTGALNIAEHTITEHNMPFMTYYNITYHNKTYHNIKKYNITPPNKTLH